MSSSQYTPAEMDLVKRLSGAAGTGDVWLTLECELPDAKLYNHPQLAGEPNSKANDLRRPSQCPALPLPFENTPRIVPGQSGSLIWHARRWLTLAHPAGH